MRLCEDIDKRFLHLLAGFQHLEIGGVITAGLHEIYHLARYANPGSRIAGGSQPCGSILNCTFGNPQTT